MAYAAAPPQMPEEHSRVASLLAAASLSDPEIDKKDAHVLTPDRVYLK